jgi:hypothetical protein
VSGRPEIGSFGIDKMPAMGGHDFLLVGSRRLGFGG